MRLLDSVAPNLTDVLRRDWFWMSWNTLLAWIPVLVAFATFRRRERPGHVVWWMGAVLFVLFLPNAPYVVTDLVHMRDDVVMVGEDFAVVTAVLPVYTVFIASGFLSYYLALRELGGFLDRAGYGARWGTLLVGIHGLCAVGVFLGRHVRLNSWEPVVEPADTLERIMMGLSWRWAPFLIVATFVVTWLGHFVTRTLVEAAGNAAVRAYHLVANR